MFYIYIYILVYTDNIEAHSQLVKLMYLFLGRLFANHNSFQQNCQAELSCLDAFGPVDGRSPKQPPGMCKTL